ncbi:SprT-like domain-containing protein [Verrucomicrobiota bacterium]
MRLPTFVLKELKRGLSYWSKERREIGFNRNFVLNHPWLYVRDVLLHEMAHQFAHEVLGGGDEAPHGPLFQKACHFLRADPKASADYLPLKHWIHRDALSENDRILLRVQKLLSLAQSNNQHEAEAAMAKAHELIAKYNLDLLASEKQRKFHSMCVGESALRRPRQDSYLANLLQDFYFVRTIWIPAYVLEKGKVGRVLEISGTGENLKLASYVHDFVLRFIEEQWIHYSSKTGLSSRKKTDFAMGIIQGFRNTLESQEKARMRGEETTCALVKLEDHQLSEYYRYKYPRVCHTHSERRIRDIGVQKDGERCGKKMVISKPIEITKEDRKLLIGV